MCISSFTVHVHNKVCTYSGKPGMPKGEKIWGWGASIKGWAISAPLVGIGLTDVLNFNFIGRNWKSLWKVFTHLCHHCTDPGSR